MHAALAQLHDALDAGDRPGAQRAVAVVRALVSGHQGVHASRNAVAMIAGDSPQLVGPDGADLSALALLADARRGAPYLPGQLPSAFSRRRRRINLRL